MNECVFGIIVDLKIICFQNLYYEPISLFIYFVNPSGIFFSFFSTDIVYILYLDVVYVGVSLCV